MIKVINNDRRARIEFSPSQLTVEANAQLTLPISYPPQLRFALRREDYELFSVLFSDQNSYLVNDEFGCYLQLYYPGDLHAQGKDERLLLVTYGATKVNFDTPKVYGGSVVTVVDGYMGGGYLRRDRILLANLDHENGAVIFPIRDMASGDLTEFRAYTWKNEVKVLSPTDYPKFAQKLHWNLVTETLDKMLRSSPLADDSSWLKLYGDRLTVFCPENDNTPARRDYYDISEKKATVELARLAAKLPVYEQAYLAYQEKQNQKTKS